MGNREIRFVLIGATAIVAAFKLYQINSTNQELVTARDLLWERLAMIDDDLQKKYIDEVIESMELQFKF